MATPPEVCPHCHAPANACCVLIDLDDGSTYRSDACYERENTSLRKRVESLEGALKDITAINPDSCEGSAMEECGELYDAACEMRKIAKKALHPETRTENK